MNSEIQKLNNEVNPGGLSLLKPAKNTMAYLKMGIFGDTGSGKTWTASLVALGLHKYLKTKRPVAFFDTETGSSFVKPSFDKAGVELLAFQGNSLVDLNAIIKEAEKACSLLIIDSISHVWEEYTDSYLKKSKQGFIELWDWKPIKSKWRDQFTTPFVNSNLHIIMCGRESGIYQEVEVEKGGKVRTQSVRVGDKMKAESEVGYEPSLLCQMEKVFLKEGGNYVRRCNVIKERFNVIDSKYFDNPIFEDFLPHVELLNLGGEHGVADPSRNSQDLFDEPNNTWDERRRKVEITLEKIKAEFVKADLDGTAAATKKARIALLEEIFGTTAWAQVESMKLEDLNACLEQMQNRDLVKWRDNFLSGKGSKAVGE